MCCDTNNVSRSAEQDENKLATNSIVCYVIARRLFSPSPLSSFPRSAVASIHIFRFKTEPNDHELNLSLGFSFFFSTTSLNVLRFIHNHQAKKKPTFPLRSNAMLLSALRLFTHISQPPTTAENFHRHNIIISWEVSSFFRLCIRTSSVLLCSVYENVRPYVALLSLNCGLRALIRHSFIHILLHFHSIFSAHIASPLLFMYFTLSLAHIWVFFTSFSLPFLVRHRLTDLRRSRSLDLVASKSAFWPNLRSHISSGPQRSLQRSSNNTRPTECRGEQAQTNNTTPHSSVDGIVTNEPT